MSDALTSLNQVPGVVGSALFNARDECVVHLMPPPWEAALLGKAMVELRNSLNVLSYLDDNASWNAIVVRFEAGYLVVRHFGEQIVLVIAQPTLNPAMLSVALNVAALKLEKELAPPLPPPPAAPGPRMTGPIMIPVVTQSSPSLSQSNPNLSQSQGRLGSGAVSQSNPQLSSSAGFRTESQGSQGADLMAPVIDAVGKPVIEALLRALARHIGPFAKLMMKEELTKLGVTASTLGFAQYEDFIAMLGQRLQDPNQRRQFLLEAEGLAKR